MTLVIAVTGLLELHFNGLCNILIPDCFIVLVKWWVLLEFPLLIGVINCWISTFKSYGSLPKNLICCSFIYCRNEYSLVWGWETVFNNCIWPRSQNFYLLTSIGVIITYHNLVTCILLRTMKVIYHNFFVQIVCTKLICVLLCEICFVNSLTRQTLNNVFFSW